MSWRFIFARAGVGLGLGGAAGHHAGDVEVLDDDVLVLGDQLLGHEVLFVAAEVSDAAVEIVDTALGFPPAAGAGGASCLRSLPAAQPFLGGVVSLGILPGLTVAVSGEGIDAGVHNAVFDAVVGVGYVLRRFPVVDGEDPLAVGEFDVGFVDDALWQGGLQFDATEAG